MKKEEYFSVIYEDDSLVGVNKASGISVGADRWDTERERLDKMLAKMYAEKCRIFTVHRIDKETSGVVIFAKNDEVHKNLSKAFENRLVKKQYIAVVCSRPSWKETECNLPLVPDGDKLHRTITDRYKGKKSLTRFKVLVSTMNYAVVEAFPETGRTHQIRVHLASMGHPIVCDPLYGNNPKPVYLSSFKRGWRGDPLDERPLLARLGLHASLVTLPEGVTVQAPLPRDMSALVKQMQKSGYAD